MKFINILEVDKPNILNEFLNYKQALESQLNLDKEMSYEEYVKYLHLEKQVFVYKNDYTFTFSKIKINDEDILFYTAEQNFPEESFEKFYSFMEDFKIDNFKKIDVYNGEDNILEKEYYFILNNEFYY